MLYVPESYVRVADDDAGTGYFCDPCGREHERVTKLVDACCPKWALVPWAENTALDAAIAIYADTGSLPNNRQALKEASKRRQLDCDSAKQAGGSRGSELHAYLNQFVQSATVAPLSDLSPEYRGYGQQLAKFLIDYEPEFLCSEVLIVHHVLDYAGRTDGICVIHRQPVKRNKPIDLTGKTVLFDLKTNREGRVYRPSMNYQVAGYELAWREMGGEPNDHQVIVAVGEESYQLAVSGFEPESFRDLVNFYRSQREAMAA